MASVCEEGGRGKHTGNALIQNVVRVQDIVEQFLAGIIEDQDLPLQERD
jgi:hypothetical protein